MMTISKSYHNNLDERQKKKLNCVKNHLPYFNVLFPNCAIIVLQIL